MTSSPVRLLPLATILLAVLRVSAQTTTITGTVLDESGEGALFANVLLVSAADTAFVGGAVTDELGAYTLTTEAPSGDYRLQVTSIGYADAFGEAFALERGGEVAAAPLTLGSDAVQLDVATVTARRQFITRRIDRTVVNVSDDVTALGQTALEVLERAPGVFVDRGSNSLQMLGKEGVNVMINGRLNYMPADALLTYLAGIPAGDIVRLELITTPPADLDAEGNAGYIDIVLRRLPDEGLRGSYTLSAGLGANRLSDDGWSYGEELNGNLNATYRRGKVSAFGGLGYVRNARPSASYLRRVGTSAAGEQRVDLAFDRDPGRHVVNARLGADFQLAERTTLGVLASGYVNRFTLDGDQRNRFGVDAAPDTLLRTDVTEANNWSHLQTGVTLSQNLARGGKLSGGVDYLYYDNDNPVDYALRYRDAATESTVFRTEALASRKVTPFGILVGRVDYETALGEGQFKLGAKAVRSDFENAVSLRRDGVPDARFTSDNTLDEWVAAAYAQYAGSLGLGGERALDYQIGLRFEQTDTELLEVGRAVPVVDRDYGQWFPSVAVGYPLSERTKATAGYARRIERPAFTDMAPFVIFLTPTTNFGGNPALQPALSHNVELGLQRGGLGLTLAYSTIDSAIVGFQDRYDAVRGLQIIQPVNLRQLETFSASLGLPTQFASWWGGRLNATLSYQEATTVIDGAAIPRDAWTLQVGGAQNFELGTDWRLALSGFFRGPSVAGYTRTLAIGTLNAALQRTLPTGTLTVGVDDALNTLEARGETFVPEIGFRSERGFDFSGPTLKVTWAGTFGNDRVRELDRDSAAEERGRVD